MDIAEIRRFRSSLRTFQRIMSLQQKNCCSGVTLAQCIVLVQLEDDERLTMGQLSSRLRLDNSTLTRTVEALVRLGLVERVPDDRDRRVVWIEMTAKGQATCGSIHEQNDACCQRAFDRIPASRRAAVVKSFEVLTQAFLDCEDESSLAACSGKTSTTST